MRKPHSGDGGRGNPAQIDRERVVAKTLLLERGRRRIDHAERAAGLDRQHGKTAIHGSVGVETKDAVDTGKAVGVGQRGRCKALVRRARRQQRHKRHRVIGERRQRRRRRAEGIAIFGGEGGVGFRIGRRKPAVVQQRFAADGRVVPQTRAQQLHLGAVDSVVRQRRHDAAQQRAALGDQDRVGIGFRDRGSGFDDLARRGIEVLDVGDLATRRRDGVVERLRHDVAIGRFGNECREGLAPLRDRIGDDAFDFVLRQEAQEVNAVAGNAHVGGEGEHRNALVARERRHGRDGLREDRPDDDLGALSSATSAPRRPRRRMCRCRRRSSAGCRSCRRRTGRAVRPSTSNWRAGAWSASRSRTAAECRRAPALCRPACWAGAGSRAPPGSADAARAVAAAPAGR